LGSRSAIDAFLELCSDKFPDWQFIFVAELSCTLSWTNSDFNLGEGWSWQGAHSRCMALFVRKSVRFLVNKTFFFDRVGGVLLKFNRRHLLLCGVHMRHGDELYNSLADFSNCVNCSPKGCPVFAVGDWNTDQLPIMQIDPFAEMYHRDMHHYERRLSMQTCMSTLGLDLCIPYASVDSPFWSSWEELAFFNPITRIPAESQNEIIPSCLDYSAATPGVLNEESCERCWTIGIADHASIWSRVNWQFRVWPSFSSNTFHCTSEEDYLSNLQQTHFDWLSGPDVLFHTLSSVQNSFQSAETSKQRKERRMPFELKEAIRKGSLADSYRDRSFWRDRAWQLRKKWVTDMKVQAKVRRAREGKAHSKRKKLWKLRGLVIDSHKDVDRDFCARTIASHFTEKWKGTADDQAFAHEVDNTRAFSLDVSVDEVARGFGMLNRKDTIKHDGVCVRSLELLFIAHPDEFTQWLASGIGDPDIYRSAKIMARPFGKEASYSVLDKIRLILPLSAWLSLADAIISSKLDDCFQSLFPELVPWLDSDGFFMGGNRFTQPLDITFGLQLAVEKALDLESCGGLAQFDIQQFYDSLSLRLISDFLLQLGVDWKIVTAALMHQLLPLIIVRLSGCSETPPSTSTCVSHRATGGLTGSRTAGVLAKFIVANMLSECKPLLLPYGFVSRMWISTWIDNVYITGKSASAAVSMAVILEDFLLRRWGLNVKADSKMVMPVHGGEPADLPPGWRLVHVFPALGHFIGDNGGIEFCYTEAVKEAWKAYWRNASRRSAQKLPNIMRAKRLNRMVLPVIRYRWTRWPWTLWRARLLDKLQRKMISMCISYLPQASAESSDYFRGRAKFAGNLAKQAGCWSTLWATDVVKWDEHRHRERNRWSWGNVLLKVRPRDELAWRRASFNGRPRTRACQGWACRRWHDGLEEAKTFLI